jgi:hypothetical protein
LTGRGDPKTGASLKNAPWTGSGPSGGYGVLTYLWSYHGTQMAWGYNSNRIYIRTKYYDKSSNSSVWYSTWDSIALVSEIPTSSTVSGWGFTKNTGTITQIKVNGTSVATSGIANIPIATSTADGAMSSTHVSKLSSVESAVSTLSSEKLDKPSAWVTASLTLSGATSVSTNPVRYRLCGNLLTIQGAFTYTYGSASDGTLKLFTLPSGYRSSYSHSSWQYATGNWMWRLYIDANGVVYIHSIVHPKNNTTTNSSSMTFLITVSYYLD